MTAGHAAAAIGSGIIVGWVIAVVLLYLALASDRLARALDCSVMQ